MKKIQVAVFDDNLFFRKSIHMLLEDREDLSLKGSFRDGKNVIRDVKKTSPDVVLMDIDMPGVNGIDALKKIKKEFPSLPVIMVTDYDDEDKIMDSFCADANGYILKTSSAREIIHGIHEAYKGHYTLCTMMAKRVVKLFTRQHMNVIRGGQHHGLTARQLDVLGELVRGASYKMIAGKLGITYDTVRAHIKQIYARLGVNSVSAAVAKAIKQNIVS